MSEIAGDFIVPVLMGTSRSVRTPVGSVEGEYSINLGDGRVRVVKYLANENGYRADATTDDLDTESKNPNDVYIAILRYEAALKYGLFAPPAHIEQPLFVAERPQLETINNKVGTEWLEGY
ncbi:hypothetical protein BIW11_04655 [Tropilaelaps mercedesae]|uniref:Uncharacterized protein n=1 Tax=Tropilaelaps mercedesae TaxID=418985 RepID=A0A1V9X2W6_9ACAR|nr:hypothetical protein BIW11_04655 [Tropilaelaps mercedesae]